MMPQARPGLRPAAPSPSGPLVCVCVSILEINFSAYCLGIKLTLLRTVGLWGGLCVYIIVEYYVKLCYLFVYLDFT